MPASRNAPSAAPSLVPRMVERDRDEDRGRRKRRLAVAYMGHDVMIWLTLCKASFSALTAMGSVAGSIFTRESVAREDANSGGESGRGEDSLN